MVRKILKVVLWFILFGSISFTALFAVMRVSEGQLSEIFMVLLLIIPAIIAGIVLLCMRNREKLRKLKEPYELRLKQWEAEGYDVSEFREKLISMRETKVRSGKYWLAVVLTIIILPTSSITWKELQGEAPQLYSQHLQLHLHLLLLQHHLRPHYHPQLRHRHHVLYRSRYPTMFTT